MCKKSMDAYAHHLNFQYNNFGDISSIVKKRPLLVNLSIPHCGMYFISQWSTPLVGMRLCRHVPNSPSYKNKMMTPSMSTWKSCFSSQNFVVPHWHMEKNLFHQLYDLTSGKDWVCEFDKHVNRQVNYKIL